MKAGMSKTVLSFLRTQVGDKLTLDVIEVLCFTKVADAPIERYVRSAIERPGRAHLMRAQFDQAAIATLCQAYIAYHNRKVDLLDLEPPYLVHIRAMNRAFDESEEVQNMIKLLERVGIPRKAIEHYHGNYPGLLIKDDQGNEAHLYDFTDENHPRGEYAVNWQLDVEDGIMPFISEHNMRRFLSVQNEFPINLSA